MSDYRIINGWLCEVWNGCTCGAGPGTPGGTHEPGCGLEPIVELSTLDGWPNTAQAVAIERNMTATWLDKLGDDEMWADIATRYHLAAEAVRNGEHVKP